ncbi:DUF1499 domain-containing protein [Glycocaulis abyssi]|uniref:DUF1499 domain-containing protein n=1 Tax=Glycocaulis abyssi TaxID=1433403 RepID=A0ABV9NEU3_9PROT
MPRNRPVPLDFATLRPPSKPRWFLVLPEGYESLAQPHLRSLSVAMAPVDALARFKAIALQAPRTRLVHEGGLQIGLEQKSAVWRFTDKITVEAIEAGPGFSALAIYSRALLGFYDFGVNRKRVTRWLDAFYAAGSAK